MFRTTVAQMVQEREAPPVSPLLEALIPFGRKVADRPCLGDECDSHSVRRHHRALLPWGARDLRSSGRPCCCCPIHGQS